MARKDRPNFSNESNASIVAKTEGEVHFLAQALDYYRAVQQAGEDAPFGQFLNYAEAAVDEKGRELLRSSLENIVQTKIDEVEKENESRLCPDCQRKREHLGYHSKTIRTSSGLIKPDRRYEKCRTCGLPVHHVDAILGLEDYSAGFRFLAVRAGSKGSFEEAEKEMKVWRGLEVSHETIRMLCHKEAPKVKEFFENSPEVPKDFIAAKGRREFLMDAAKVNTLKGWRDIKIGIFSVRPFGVGTDILYWSERDRTMLPDVSASVAFAAIEEKEFFQVRVNRYRRLLRIGSTGDLSALGDGAEWIWNIIRAVFGPVRECLDIYHALEHLSHAGKVLYREGTIEYDHWRELTKWELLDSGFEKIETRLNAIEQELIVEGRELTATEKQKKEAIGSLRRYLENHKTRLGYRERLSEGRVIGSGQVEGACKSMIGRRLKQTGARWDDGRLNEMAVLCSVHYSDLWEKYWMQAI